ncbi:hypothetical protein [Pantoea allii]|uniref:hypothetical protein n=1 Tax=Pantoea allii TaxID=574096 RepID=UPI0024B77606|nr:hypothetical protein [Pantoea allii]MDJ0087689.1 hypothetical protein [Pantoea allii]
MNREQIIQERLSALRQFLINEGNVTSGDIHLHFASAGLSQKKVDHLIRVAYQTGMTHRKKIREAKGYHYRLAAKYPTWGTRYLTEPVHRTYCRGIVSICKKKSRIYEVDQMLKAARCGYEAR